MKKRKITEFKLIETPRSDTNDRITRKMTLSELLKLYYIYL